MRPLFTLNGDQPMNTHPFHLFDLDGTVIDSFKRIEPCLMPNGDLDLAKYKAEACTHDKIQTDQLLPLYQQMRQLINTGADVGICTARLMGKSDYYYLRKIGLKRVKFIASRDRLARYFGTQAPTIYRLGDAEYKSHWLDLLQGMFRDRPFVVYDDHAGVLSMAARKGIRTVDAKQYNALARKYFNFGLDMGRDPILYSDFLDVVRNV